MTWIETAQLLQRERPLAETEVLIEALGKNADSDANGMVSVGELSDFVGCRLPEITGDTQAAIETRFTAFSFPADSRRSRACDQFSGLQVC